MAIRKKLSDQEQLKNEKQKISTVQFQNGYYQGEQIGNTREGKGIFYWDTGQMYMGNWKNNHIDGEGVCLYPFGGYLCGNFHKGAIHGPGYLVMPNKDIISGYWQQGKLEGKFFKFIFEMNKWIMIQYIRDSPVQYSIQYSVPQITPVKQILEDHIFPKCKCKNLDKSFGVVELMDGTWFCGSLDAEYIPEGFGTIFDLKGVPSRRGYFRGTEIETIGRMMINNETQQIIKDGIFNDGFMRFGIIYYKHADRFVYGYSAKEKIENILKKGTGYPFEMMGSYKHPMKYCSSYVDQFENTELINIPYREQISLENLQPYKFKNLQVSPSHGSLSPENQSNKKFTLENQQSVSPNLRADKKDQPTAPIEKSQSVQVIYNDVLQSFKLNKYNASPQKLFLDKPQPLPGTNQKNSMSPSRSANHSPNKAIKKSPDNKIQQNFFQKNNNENDENAPKTKNYQLQINSSSDWPNQNNRQQYMNNQFTNETPRFDMNTKINKNSAQNDDRQLPLQQIQERENYQFENQIKQFMIDDNRNLVLNNRYLNSAEKKHSLKNSLYEDNIADEQQQSNSDLTQSINILDVSGRGDKKLLKTDNSVNTIFKTDRSVEFTRESQVYSNNNYQQFDNFQIENEDFFIKKTRSQTILEFMRESKMSDQTEDFQNRNIIFPNQQKKMIFEQLQQEDDFQIQKLKESQNFNNLSSSYYLQTTQHNR